MNETWTLIERQKRGYKNINYYKIFNSNAVPPPPLLNNNGIFGKIWYIYTIFYIFMHSTFFLTHWNLVYKKNWFIIQKKSGGSFGFQHTGCPTKSLQTWNHKLILAETNKKRYYDRLPILKSEGATTIFLSNISVSMERNFFNNMNLIVIIESTNKIKKTILSTKFLQNWNWKKEMKSWK